MNEYSPKNILFGFDGSEHSLAAVAFLNDFFSEARIKPNINLVSVITPRQATDHAAIQDTLDSASSFLTEKSFSLKSELILGYPAEKILEIANNENTDLIMVGAKGLRATFGILLGGVAQQVIEYAACPVLVVRAPYTGQNKYMLVTDGSIYSETATNFIANFPLPDNIEIFVMHVMAPTPLKPSQGYVSQYLPVGPDIYPPPLYETADENARVQQDIDETEGKKVIKKTVDLLTKRDIKTNEVLSRGDAASEIIRNVKEHDIDLIIAGSRGLSQIKGLLLGTVSRKLVHYASCSVLVVREGN